MIPLPLAFERVRVSENMDDGIEVGKSVAAAEIVQVDKENQDEIFRNQAYSSDVLVSKIAEKVDRIATNIANGDSVNSSITEAYLYINSSNLNEKNAVRILICGKLTLSENYKIFAQLVCNDFGVSDLMKSMMDKYPDFKAAIPEIVENGISKGLILIGDKNKFIQLFSAWTTGVRPNRPTLGKWKGQPWEKWDSFNLAYQLNETSLMRNVIGTNVQVCYEGGGVGPTELVSAENLHKFKLIWSDTTGKSLNITESLIIAIQEFEGLVNTSKTAPSSSSSKKK